MDVWTEHQVDWPVALVDQGETAPWIPLVGLDTALEHPILNQKHVCQVGCLLAEAEVSSSIIELDVVGQLDRNGQDWLNLIVASRSCYITLSCIKQRNCELLLT